MKSASYLHHGDDEECDAKEDQRYQSTGLKQGVYSSIVSERVSRMFRVDSIGPVSEPCN